MSEESKTPLTNNVVSDLKHIFGTLWERNCADRLITEMRKLELANAELRKASEWQPIETAPKDGTWILVNRKGCPGKAVSWSNRRNGWYGADEAMAFFMEPTHWLAIPALASETKGEGL